MIITIMFVACSKHRTQESFISSTDKNSIEQSIDLKQPNTYGNARKVSENVQISGSDWFKGFGKSEQAVLNGNKMQLNIDQSNKYCWSSYRFIGLNNYLPNYVEVEVSPYYGSEWYVALANYSNKAWQWFGPYKSAKQQIKLETNYLYVNNFNTTIVIASHKKTALVESIKLMSDNPAPTRTIEGVIKDEAGFPIDGVAVSTVEFPDNKVLTDAKGSYKLENLKDGSYTVVPSKEKYLFIPNQISVLLSNNYATGVNFTGELTTGFYIGGHVINNDTSKGIEDVNVFLLPSGLRLKTNATGEFLFKKQPPGKYLVRVVNSAYDFDVSEQEIEIVDKSNTNVDFTGSINSFAPGTISGVIVDIYGTPVQYIRNSLNPTDKMSITDEKGNLIFTNCSDGNYTVTPNSNIQSFEPTYRTQKITGNSSAGQDFIAIPQLPGIGSIEGFFIDNDTKLPVPNVTVYLDKKVYYSTTLTNDKGYYRFDKIKPSTYTIYGRIPGYSWDPLNYTVKIDGETIKDKNFNGTYFPGKYLISGKVSDKSGKPQTNVPVTLYPIIKTVNTDVNGEYTFQKVPAGSYYLLINEPYYSYIPSARDVVISNADVTNQDFERILGNGGSFKISGILTQNDGTPIFNSYVFLSSTKELLYGKTDIDGKYQFDNLTPQSYTVEPSDNSFSFNPYNQNVTITNEDISKINFVGSAIGYSISGWVYEPGNQSLSNVVLVLEPGGQQYTTSSGGYFVFSNLTPGNYILTPNASSYRFAPENRFISLSNQNVDFQDFIGEKGNGGKYHISGVFLEKDTLNWISGQKITLLPDKYVRYTALDGSFMFSNLMPGDYQIVYDSYSYDFEPIDLKVTIVDKNDDSLYVEGTPGKGTVSGYVFDKLDIPITGCVVTITPGDFLAYTNIKGQYKINKIKKGKYTVTPSMPSMTFTPISTDIESNENDLIDINFKAN